MCLAMIILKENRILLQNNFKTSFPVKSIFEISLECLIFKTAFSRTGPFPGECLSVDFAANRFTGGATESLRHRHRPDRIYCRFCKLVNRGIGDLV